MSRSFKGQAAAGDAEVYAAATTAHDVGMRPVPVAPFAPMRRWPLARGSAALAGGLALLLLLAAEAGVSLLAGRDLAAHGALYRTAEAQLGLAGQVVFGLLPAVFAGRKSR
jgi:hypothetical protein